MDEEIIEKLDRRQSQRPGQSLRRKEPHMNLAIAHILVAAALLGGCAGGPSLDATGGAAALSGARALRLQAGTRLIVYGVTDDDYAVYQDGGSLFASALYPGAARHQIADVGTMQPTVLISGRVALVWTGQFYFGSGGVSPLVVWTAAAGPKLAAAASVVSIAGTRAAAVRPDSGEILFVSNAAADGSVGDIVSATPDLAVVQTLVSGVDVNVAGHCLPLVGYDGQARAAADDGREGRCTPRPIVAWCAAGATSATLSRFVGGARSDLAGNLAVPPTWSSDAAGASFFTIVGAERTPVLVDTRGAARVLENAPTSRGFIDVDGSIVTSAGVGGVNELHRLSRDPLVAEVVASMGSSSFYQGHHAEGFRQYNDTATSRDGRLMLYGNAVDPNTGLTTLFLVDIAHTPPAPLQLQASTIAAQSFELFTRDSSHALYYTFDVTNGATRLFAASLAGDNRQISSGAPTEFAHFALTGSLVAFSDNLVGTGIDLFDRNDIVLADVGATQIAPVTLAVQAYNLFFPTHDRRAIVFTSDHDPAATGLFIIATR
jgi:hypothetical protein